MSKKKETHQDQFESVENALSKTEHYIEEKQVHRAVKRVPVTPPKGESVPAGLNISPQKITIHASIPYSLSQKTRDYKSLFNATFTASGLKPGTHKITVLAKPAEGVKILEIIPPQVTVTVPPAKK